MKLFYYRDIVPNFGDELNPWLFERLLPNMLDDDPSDLLLGVGSILFDNHPALSRKIVFGSGFGGYRPPPIVDDTWKVYFVRGPLTANAIGVDSALGVGDAATLIARIDALPSNDAMQRGPIFIPHWESALDGSWDLAAAEAGLRYVDPRSSVEEVVTAIRSSSYVVTEAMHGAIVADALRVPWIPFRPILEKHRFKWADWGQSLGLTIDFAPSVPSSWNEWANQRLRILQQRSTVARPQSLLNVVPEGKSSSSGILGTARSFARHYKHIGGGFARLPAVRALRDAAKSPPHLSDTLRTNEALTKMEHYLEQLKHDYFGK